MKLFPLVILLASLLSPVHAEEPRATGISPELLGELERSLTMGDRAHLARNVLAQFDQNKINIDWDKVIAVDRHFSHKLPAGKITNQESTGRCWMFAG
ncbi:MAG TPA: C1 family peptidase, partial [Candidatus Aminicenantes bacterium]|nr:C1 family peptidase [Candidatus Aminicenantes bacterium]